MSGGPHVRDEKYAEATFANRSSTIFNHDQDVSIWRAMLLFYRDAHFLQETVDAGEL